MSTSRNLAWEQANRSIYSNYSKCWDDYYAEYRIKSFDFTLMNPKRCVKDVIFNDPATVVLWRDGTKTVVKSSNEKFDPEKGLAMAFAKKMFGNKGNYYNVFKKFLSKYSGGKNNEQ